MSKSSSNGGAAKPAYRRPTVSELGVDRTATAPFAVGAPEDATYNS